MKVFHCPDCSTRTIVEHFNYNPKSIQSVNKNPNPNRDRYYVCPTCNNTFEVLKSGVAIQLTSGTF